MSPESRARTLQAYFASSNAPLRPILTSLNGDNSWLISFPRPPADRIRHGGKAYFHIVSDAWLTRDVSLGASWVINLRHPTEPTIPDGDAVEALVQEVEAAAADAAGNSPSGTASPESKNPLVDAIFVNFHYADHLNEATLRTFSPSIPVFATAEAAAMIRPWNYFHHLSQTHDLDPSNPAWLNLRPDGDAQLPDWLAVFRLVGHHELNFATAIVYSSPCPAAADNNTNTTTTTTEEPESTTQHEVLLYSPHGIRTTQPALQAFTHRLHPPVRVLAMLHALKDSFALGWMRNTLGVAGGLALARLVRPRYWVKSHDAMLVYSGVVAWLAGIKDFGRTLEDGLVEEGGTGVGGEFMLEEGGGDGLNGNGDRGKRKLGVVEVENGGCFVLE
jgi:hypothetical protein